MLNFFNVNSNNNVSSKIFGTVNYLVIFVYIYDLIFNIYFGINKVIPIDIIGIGFLFLSRVLYKKDYNNLSIAILYLFINIGIVISDTNQGNLGNESGIIFYFFPALISIILFVHSSQPKGIIIFALAITFICITITFFNNDWITPQISNEKDLNTIYISNMILAILITLYPVYWTNKIIYSRNTYMETIIELEQEKSKIKDIYLKEINHRVKNNFQVIDSLMRLQRQKGVNQETVSALQNAQNRIHAMSLVHETIYKNEFISKINLKAYFIDLIKGILSAYQIKEQKVELLLHSEEIFLSSEIMVPLGVILNELTTNSMKHAVFNKENEITIYAKRDSDFINISYQDSGMDYNRDNLFKNKSMGIELIEVLCDQLEAKYVFQEGTSFSFNMKIPIKKAS
jgi:two-component sensor histidine kinase